MSVILENVGHRFSTTHWLFRSVDHVFEAGVTTSLTGPSGSGKSTLLAILAGSLTPTEGEVHGCGGLRTRWVFQNPVGVPRRTALDHVVLPLLASGSHRGVATNRALEIMDQFGLDEVAHRRFGQLSGGEAQRLMLARAVASRPDLLLVDEPTAQLDQHASSVVAGVLASLSDGGAVVVVATHDPVARRACQANLDVACHAG